MNAHWVKWVSVLALGLAGVLGVACGDDDDDDNDGKNGSSGAGGRGGSGGGTNGSGNNGSAGGTSGAGGGASGAGGGGQPAPPPSDKAGVIAAFNARKFDPDDFAAAQPKWVCQGAPSDVEAGSPHGEKSGTDVIGQNRTCANFQIAGVDAGDCANDEYNVNAAASKEIFDDEGKMIGFAWYVKTAGGWFWFSAPVTGASGQETIDESDASKITAGIGLAGCEGCHGANNNPNEFSLKAHTLSRGNLLLLPAPDACGIEED